jgi:hypothetical protein
LGEATAAEMVARSRYKNIVDAVKQRGVRKRCRGTLIKRKLFICLLSSRLLAIVLKPFHTNASDAFGSINAYMYGFVVSILTYVLWTMP